MYCLSEVLQNRNLSRVCSITWRLSLALQNTYGNPRTARRLFGDLKREKSPNRTFVCSKDTLQTSENYFYTLKINRAKSV